MSSSEDFVNDSVPTQITTMDKITPATSLLPKSDANDTSCTPLEVLLTVTGLTGGAIIGGGVGALLGLAAGYGKFGLFACGISGVGLGTTGVLAGLVCQKELHKDFNEHQKLPSLN